MAILAVPPSPCRESHQTLTLQVEPAAARILSRCQSPCHQRKPLSPAEFQLPVTEPDINNRLESLCLSMTEHALGGECVLRAWPGLAHPGEPLALRAQGGGAGAGERGRGGLLDPTSSHTIHSTQRRTRRAPAPCSAPPLGVTRGPGEHAVPLSPAAPPPRAHRSPSPMTVPAKCGHRRSQEHKTWLLVETSPHSIGFFPSRH